MAKAGQDRASGAPARPLVCMYLFLDACGATMPPHPSPRTASPLRYLECAVAQAASLRLAAGSCEIALVTNIDAARLSRRGRRLWRALAGLEVEPWPLGLRIAPGTDAAATRLPREAIRAAAGATRPEREVWVPNLDSIWVDPVRALQGGPPAGAVGCLAIPYPADWRVGGPEKVGATRTALGQRAAALGAPPAQAVPPWIGADLLVGTAATLAQLARACDELDAGFSGTGLTATNEQLLTLVAALGRVETHDLSQLARRIQTGARHTAGTQAGAADLGIWHLPAEKGLSLRRAGRLVARGRGEKLRADLAAPGRAMARFNVGPARRMRQLRDDAWVALARVAQGRAGRAAGTLQPIGQAVEGRKD